jgi:hypothetical protein
MPSKEALDPKFLKSLARNRRVLVVSGRLILAGMITAFLVPFILIGEIFLQDWIGWFLLPFVFFLSLESMAAHYRTRELDGFNKKYIFFHLTELVVILVIIKLILLALHDPGGINLDIEVWRPGWIRNFFDIEYTLLVVITISIWVFCGDLDRMLIQIAGDEKFLQAEFDTGFSSERIELRQKLANQMIFFGGVMVVLLAIIKLGATNVFPGLDNLQYGAWALVLYFILGLVLLSLTQFSILRIRWVIDHVQVEEKISSRWITFSLVLILGLALLALFLPFDYSRDILGLLQSILLFLFNLIALIIYFITLPFIIIIGWLMNLFTRGDGTPIPTRPEQFEFPQFAASPPNPWLEQIKGIIFSAMLALFVGYAFYYYLREHPEYFNWLLHRRTIQVLKKLWKTILGWLLGVNAQVGQVVRNGLRRLRSLDDGGERVAPSRLFNPRRLSPRQQVIFYYLAIVRRGADKGVPRPAAQTPLEYSQRLNSYLANIVSQAPHGREDKAPVSPAADPENFGEDIMAITDKFIEARYSQHPITLQQASLARLSWERILRLFRRV